MKKYDQAYDLFIIFIKWLSHYKLNFPMNTDSNIETKSVSVRANGPKHRRNSDIGSDGTISD